MDLEMARNTKEKEGNTLKFIRITESKLETMVRSTLLWHPPPAAPSGEIGGVTVMCSRETFDWIYHDQKLINLKKSA